jgi:hypothetical protein
MQHSLCSQVCDHPEVNLECRRMGCKANSEVQDKIWTVGYQEVQVGHSKERRSVGAMQTVILTH